MKKYRVWAECTTDLYIDVYANDEDEAYEIAEAADGSEFTECPDGEWKTLRNSISEI